LSILFTITKKSASRINYWSLLLLVFCLPLADRLVSVAGLIWFLSFIFIGNLKERIKPIAHPYLYVALLLYFMITVIWVLADNTKGYAWEHIESKLSFLAFPFFFAIASKEIKENQNKFLYAFIFGNIIASFYCYIHTFSTNIFYENGSWILRTSFKAEFAHLSFWELVNDRVSTFSYVFLSELKQPSYFAMYIVFSVCIAVYLYKKSTNKSLKIKILLVLYLAYFTFFIYLLQSRAGIISYTVVLILLMFNELFKSRQKKYLYFLVLAAIIGGLLIFTSKTIMDNLNQVSRILTNPDKSEIEGENDRFQMWYSALPVIKENLWLGVGPLNVVDQLVEQYKENEFEVAIQYRLNAHSQYIETLLGLGITGLIILLYILVYVLAWSVRKKDYLLFFLTFLLIFNFIFETMLNRMAGIVFMMTFLGIFLFSEKPSKTK
jgi:O-antigen ligase